jgi:hypothetical protein
MESRSGSRSLAFEPQREQLDGVDFERAFSKAMLHLPEEHLAEEQLTSQR